MADEEAWPSLHGVDGASRIRHAVQETCPSPKSHRDNNPPESVVIYSPSTATLFRAAFGLL
jgi:hypothetical protein